MRITLAISAAGLLLVPFTQGRGAVDVTITTAMREYCHIVNFRQGWKIVDYDPKIHQALYYGYDSPYEFRVPGVLETTFLVGGVVLPTRQNTINKYKVDLSDLQAIPRPATESEWRDGTRLPDTRVSDWKTFANVHVENDQTLPFHGFQFSKSGNIWPGEYARLSPDQAWLVLLSSSGKTAKRDEFLISGGRDKGKLFFDVFHADTGEKIITIVATYQDVEPGGAINQSAWVTERYFIVPLGEHRERCLVCDFSRAGKSGGVKQ